MMILDVIVEDKKKRLKEHKARTRACLKNILSCSF